MKHFAGYSQSINGHDRNEALLPLSYLQSVILPSYAGAIDAGAQTVMVDSGSINGVPATASHYLLTDILRKQMGFQGRGDQRLPGRAGAADRLPRRP